MKKEIQKFDKKKIEEMQEKYRVIKKKKSNYFDELKEKTQIYQKARFYKEALDDGKIKEEEIPKEYVEEIRNIYKEELENLKRIYNTK